MYNIDEITKKTTDIVNSAMVDYRTFRQKDDEQKKISLKPGEKLGFATNYGFYYPENAENCENALRNHRSKLAEMLEETKTEIKRKTAEPPTTEQANLLVALSVGKPTKEELQNAIENNLTNYTTYSALKRIAAENEIYIDSRSPVDDLRDVENNISNSINRMYVSRAESGLSPAFNQFANLMNGIF